MSRQTVLDKLNLSQQYDNHVHPMVMRNFPGLKATPQTEDASRLAGKLILGSLGLGGLASLLFAQEGRAADTLYGGKDDTADYQILR